MASNAYLDVKGSIFEKKLNLSQEQKIRMVTAFYIKGTFWLAPMSFLKEFEEK
jgi:hypothetical protein